MEKALSDEKSRSKRTISDQKAKIRTLEKELTEVRTEAKHLEIRNRALSNELATYKRSKVRGRVSRDSSRESRISRVSQDWLQKSMKSSFCYENIFQPKKSREFRPCVGVILESHLEKEQNDHLHMLDQLHLQGTF